MRIVSLLPSATEILCEIGLGEYLVGVSHECDYPDFVKDLPPVTKSLIPKDASSAEIDIAVKQQLQTEKAIYHLDFEVLESLRPDVIVTQSLCEVCAVAASEVTDAVCELNTNAKIVNLEPMSLQDVFDTLLLVGKETNHINQSEHAVSQLKQRVESVKTTTKTEITNEDKPGVIFLEWIDPPFNAGHWTPELIEYAGGVDLIGNKHQPSSQITWDSIVESDPDILFIACCGFDTDRNLEDMNFLIERKGWTELKAVRENNVFITDGNAYFSRPGPRLVEGLELMAHAFHPTIHKLPENLSPIIKFTAN